MNLKLIPVTVKEGEFEEAVDKWALIDPNRVESATQCDDFVEIMMHSGDFHHTTLTLSELETRLD